MKKTEDQVGSQEQLLQARDRNLQQIEKGSIRPHGKLWGMDVFSWYNPLVFELENTLSSFPAPVLWFGNATDVNQLMNENVEALLNVRLICTHDQADFALSTDSSKQIETCTGTTTLNEALSLMKTVRKEHGILLFTASGEDWKDKRDLFEAFLNLHQS